MVGALALLALIFLFVDDGWSVSIIIVLVGPFLLMAFGMFVELCNHVLDIRNAIQSDKTIAQSINHYGEVQAKSSISNNTSSSWYCRKCGTTNDASDKNCTGCGTPSANSMGSSGNSGYDLSKIAQEADLNKKPEEGWFCRQCGYKNKIHVTQCASCGKNK